MTTPATQIGHHHTDPPPLPDRGARRLASAPGRAFSARELASMIGVPLLWAILLLFHPAGDGKEMYLDLHDKVTPTLVVHLGSAALHPAHGHRRACPPARPRWNRGADQPNRARSVRAARIDVMAGRRHVPRPREEPR